MGHAGEEPSSNDRSTATSTREDDDDASTIRQVKEENAALTPKLESSQTSQRDIQSPTTAEEPRPPLPPRPGQLGLLREGSYSTGNTLQKPKKSSRPSLLSTATTALSRTDIHTHSYQDGTRETFAASPRASPSLKPVPAFESIRRFKGLGDSEGGDSASLKSYAPTLETGGEVESLLGDVLGSSQESSARKLLSTQNEAPDPFEAVLYEDDEVTADFYREFDEISAIDADGTNEGKKPTK